MKKVILILVLCFGAAHSLDFEHCDENEGAVPVDFHIYKCHELPCILMRDNKTTGNIKFIAAEEINHIDVEVHLSPGIPTSFAGEGVHRCPRTHDGECKYEAGTRVNYFFLIPVYIDTAEDFILKFKIILKNENGTPLTCAKFDAKIRDQPNPEVPVTESTS